MIRRSFKDRFSRRVKAESETMEYEVPGFWGFYNSGYVEESDLIWTFLDDPNSLPDEAEEAVEDFFGSEMDYSIDKEYMNNVGEVYTKKFDEAMKDILPSWKGSTFVEIESPKSYNFTTDRCFAKTVIDDAVAGDIKEYIESNKAAFDKFISDRFRARDGFIPFYSNDPEKWTKALTEMDYNELSAVFDFILENERVDTDEINIFALNTLIEDGADYNGYLYEKNADAFQKYMKEKGFDLEEYQ